MEQWSPPEVVLHPVTGVAGEVSYELYMALVNIKYYKTK